jgi:uncharacterized protein
VIPERVHQSLRLANPWWERKPIPKHFTPSFERPQLKTIIDYEKLGRIIFIKGPRRTGKTTLLYQYIAKLLEKKVNPRNIIFASMDDLNLRISIQELIDVCGIINGSSKKTKTYLFIDEVQFLDNWSSMAKLITDRDKSIRLVVSGSSASLLINSSESLAGRTVEETILPFTMREVIQLKSQSLAEDVPNQLQQLAAAPLSKLSFDPIYAAYRPLLEQFVREYFKRGGFPSILSIKEYSLLVDLLRTDIIQKAIYKDLTELYNIREPLALEKLFLYLIEATAGIANISSVSQQLKLPRETIGQYINYLTNAYLIFSLPKYSRYPKEILKSQEKIHIIDPALSCITGRVDSGQILESAVAGLLLRRKGVQLYYWRKNYEVDCIAEEDGKLFPIEVKNTSQPFRETEYRGLLNFMERYKPKSNLGFVIYNGAAQEIKTQYGVIRMLPAWYALTRL